VTIFQAALITWEAPLLARPKRLKYALLEQKWCVPLDIFIHLFTHIYPHKIVPWHQLMSWATRIVWASSDTSWWPGASWCVGSCAFSRGHGLWIVIQDMVRADQLNGYTLGLDHDGLNQKNNEFMFIVVWWAVTYLFGPSAGKSYCSSFYRFYASA
jgi:hypothetical protein